MSLRVFTSSRPFVRKKGCAVAPGFASEAAAQQRLVRENVLGFRAERCRDISNDPHGVQSAHVRLRDIPGGRVPQVIALSSRVSGAGFGRLFAAPGAAMVVMACASLFVAPPALEAASRPATEDAACDGIDLHWRSLTDRNNPRELNFLLFDAADLGCTTLVVKLLDAGASVHARDRAGNTAFLLAARKGHLRLTDLLDSAGADRHQTNLVGSSALLMAVLHNKRRAAEALLTMGIDPDRANSSGITPLIAAAYNGNDRIVGRLLESGADPGLSDATGKAPMVYAAGRGYLKIVERLVDSPDFEIDTRYGNDLTALIWAAGHANDVPKRDGLAIVDLLLKHGADPALADDRGRNALHVAAERGHTSIVERLLEAGISPAIVDGGGKTPLDLATDESTRAMLAKR